MTSSQEPPRAASGPDSLLAHRMREDWDLRARKDHRLYIATGAAGSDEAFRASGTSELEGAILDGIVLDPKAEALEIGCGVGRLLDPLAARVAVAHGVDISEVMIEKARAYCAGRPNVRVSVTDGTLAGFPDASLDFVFSYIVFQHIPEAAPIATYVEEAARVLRPGGLFRFQVDGRWGMQREGPATYDGVKLRPDEIHRVVCAASLEILEEWGEETHYHWVTARRPGRGAYVAAVPRAWDARLLEEIFVRLGAPEPETCALRVTTGSSSLRRELGDLEARWAASSDEEFIVGIHRALLGRDPDPAMLRDQRRLLERGLEKRSALADALLMGAGFRNLVRPLDPGVPWYRRESVGGDSNATFLEIVDALEAELRGVSGEEFLGRSFERILGRRLDDEARAHYAPRLAGGAFERRVILRDLLTTPDPRPVPPPPSSATIAALGVERTAELRCGESFAGEASVARGLLHETHGLPDRAFVARAYARILGREPESEGLDYYAGKLACGDIGRLQLVRELLWSEELRRG